MIRTLIIEDEAPAAARIEKLLKAVEPDVEVLECIDTVEWAVRWLRTHEHPDLILLDIQLADGLSFSIFREVRVESFIIFTTAFDEYALQAFELNSVDYLLKPVQEEKLRVGIQKFHRLRKSPTAFPVEALLKSLEAGNRYKKRFAVRCGSKIHSIETGEISYFRSVERATFLGTRDGHEYALDFSLDRLETLLDPQIFFRISRQHIVSISALDKIDVLSKSRLQLWLAGCPEPCLVSTAKTPAFREWIDK